MKGLLRHIFPLSLRVRFLLATAGVVLVLSLPTAWWPWWAIALAR
ncbi:Sensor protein PhoQ [Klebsiella pneumoniae ISC21]|nr:Sensor protein PhoQ [Klebsiella pneumoniae ISC21]